MTSLSTHRPSFFRFSSSAALIVAFCVPIFVGCGKKKEALDKTGPAATPQAGDPSAVVSPKPAQLQARPETTPPKERGSAKPVGPEKVIVPGAGVNAIRFGTNLEKLQEQMEAPCDIKTDTQCIYAAQAAEFTLSDGTVSAMKFHRRGRTVPGSEHKPEELKYFGNFNGGMRPNLMFGLFEHIVIEEYGEPLKKEPLVGQNGEVDRHIYKGVIFEYDRVSNGNVVLSGIEVIRPAKP